MTARALAIDGFMHAADVAWLAAQARGRRTIVEIGVWQGRSARALADAQPLDGILYGIDHWSMTPETMRAEPDAPALERLDAVRAAAEANLGDLIRARRVVLIDHDSTSGVPALLAGARVDLLFVDGDHRYPAVAADILAYAPLVAPGGILCGHDYTRHHPGVVRAVDEAFGARVEVYGVFWLVRV